MELSEKKGPLTTCLHPSLIPFASLYKSLPSARWIIVKSSTTVACQSGTPLSILTNFINPSYEILGNILSFKAYIISTKSPILGITIYKPTLINIYSYTAVSTAIDPAAPSSITATVSVYNSDSTQGIQSILTTTITYTGTIPTTGSFLVTLTVASDSYYFLVKQRNHREFFLQPLRHGVHSCRIWRNCFSDNPRHSSHQPCLRKHHHCHFCSIQQQQLPPRHCLRYLCGHYYL